MEQTQQSSDTPPSRFACFRKPTRTLRTTGAGTPSSGRLMLFGHLRTGRALVSSRAQARRHRAAEEPLRECTGRCGVERRTMWRNPPSAHVCELRAPAES